MLKVLKSSFPGWLKAILFAMAIILLPVGIWILRTQQQFQKNSIEANLLSIADLKARQISEWRAERLADAAVLASRYALINSIQRYLTNPGDSERSEIIRHLSPLMQYYKYSNILVVNPQKEVKLSLGDSTDLCSEYISIIDTTFAKHRPVWAPLHLSENTESPHIAIMTSLFSQTDDQEPVGAIILVYDATQFLYPLIESWTTPSETAETMLVQRYGNDVLFLNELRHQKDTALKFRIPINNSDLPAAMVLNGIEGIVEGTDYRGIDALAAILPVPDSPWFIVSKVDKAEAFSEWRFRSVMIIVFILCFLGLFTAVSLVAWQRNLKAHYYSLYKTEAELSQAMKRNGITLKAIGDGVISTDADGRIDLMNPIAEALTGWNKIEAHGRKLQEVFQIINEKSRKPIEDPVKCILKGDTGEGAASNKLLISRDGREIPIADQGSPIRDEDNNIVGIVFVFKDQSNERKYQNTIIKSEERYRLLADNTLDVIWTTNMDMEFIYVNSAIRQLTGHTPEEWVGTRLSEHCDGQALSIITKPISLKTANEQEYSGVVFETEMLRKDNSKIPVEIQKKVIFDKHGKPLMLQGTFRNITERKQNEKSLRSEENKYKTIIQTTIDGFWMTDLGGNLLEVNDSYCLMSGYSKKELLSMNISDLDAGMGYEGVKTKIDLTLDQGKDHFETRHRHMNGSIYDVDVTSKYLPGYDGNGVLFIFLRNITEKKIMEHSLRESEGLLRSLIKAIPDLIWLKDMKGVYLACNQMFERFFGAQEKDIIGKTDYDFVEKELADFFREHDRKAIAAGKPSSNEEWITFADDGHRALLETIKTPLLDNQGEIMGVLGVGRDITERRNTEEEKVKLEKQLLQAQKMESVGRLAGGVAHDFNNMLGVILGYGEMAIEQTTPGQQPHSALQEILKAAQRSADITSQLMAFARKQTIAPKVLDINETVAGMNKMLQRLIGEDIQLVWIPGEMVWPVIIDPSQIDQVLVNLCVNARDSITDVGKVTIETGNTIFDDEYCKANLGFLPGKYVFLAVSDEGCGMSPETMETIFDPFFTTKKAGKGTGMGLAMVYGIVKQNNGFINVYSEPGHGTTIKIYLPRHSTHADFSPIIGKDHPSTRGEEMILLVEDEPSIRRMTKMMLEKLGYTVISAGTPGEAIEYTRKYKGELHLLITDVVMPEMNGRDLAKNILSVHSDIKCLFMSGYTANVIAHHGVLDEDVNFIQKPFSMVQLGSKLREILDREQAKNS